MNVMNRKKLTGTLSTVAMCAAFLVVGVPGAATADTISLSSGGKNPNLPAGGTVIAIQAGGYAVDKVNVAVGDTVTYVNLDTVPHIVQVESAEGVTCTVSRLPVQPQDFTSCTFTTIGQYVVNDPADSRAAFRQTVTVAPASMLLSAVTASTSSSVVNKGTAVTVSGQISIRRAGIQIDVVAKQSLTGQYRKVGEARTTADGTYTFIHRPSTSTVYFVNAIQQTTIVTSPMQPVQVHAAKR